MKIQTGDICKYHGNFNGKEYTRKILVFKIEEAKTKKVKDKFICFTLNDIRYIDVNLFVKSLSANN